MSKIEEDPPVIGVQIFGWEVYRIFRDADKNILKIILFKDNVFKEFVHTMSHDGIKSLEV